ncbi:M23 family metallopeptidase [Haloechinothrix halophila]|uniref:Metalloendopeptidase-like membrane protein n=1 Tax=Haloechinothrix halophila YIM 93223 TaxID=592678 RepID=W9DN75_9PSEU|nr:peptidoglycan DD-metalloendopeptidase family protein [Haloechinothrix halophila]ETA66315.1 metalloendopeptidase-like membrane protein [Haloechinothrix halophila YIM 93223]
MVVAAVAAGAFAAATTGQALQGMTSENDVTPLANSYDLNGASGVGGDSPVAAPAVLPADDAADASAEVRKVAQSKKVTEARKQREAEARQARIEAMKPDTVSPVNGVLTSVFGARWGTTHYGIDLAAPIGTPVHAVEDGVVIEAGAASGFGLWVRVQHEDGSVSVYGHINSYYVAEGQHVEAGQPIAEVGNRGQSTGPHLHFEVWTHEDGTKLDPLGWLAERGVNL